MVSWAHPKFGTILASCSYDAKVIIWKEDQNAWTRIKDHTIHTSSVNAVQFAPHEYGLMLLCCSSDGKISVLSMGGMFLDLQDSGDWDSNVFAGHNIGANSVSWFPFSASLSLLSSTAQPNVKKFVSGGCDNLVKIFKYYIFLT
jgi:protein transport protein SEC13